MKTFNRIQPVCHLVFLTQALLFVFLSGASAKNISTKIVDGLGRPIQGVTMKVYRLKPQPNGKEKVISETEYTSDKNGKITGFYDDSNTPAPRSLWIKISKSGFSGFSTADFRSEYTLQKQIRTTAWNQLLKLQGAEQLSLLSEILAGDTHDWDQELYELIFKHEELLNHSLRKLIKNKFVQDQVVHHLSLIGNPDDIRLINNHFSELGAKRPADPVGWRRAGNEQMTVLPEAKKSSVNAVARQSEGRAFDSTPSCEAGFHTQYERREARHLNDDICRYHRAYTVISALVAPTSDDDWSVLRRCALGYNVTAAQAAVNSLKLIGSQQSLNVLEEAINHNSISDSIISEAIEYIKSSPPPIFDRDITVAGKKLASALDNKNWQKNSPPMFNANSDKALIKMEFLSGLCLSTYTATFHKVNGIWSLRGVRRTKAARLVNQ